MASVESDFHTTGRRGVTGTKHIVHPWLQLSQVHTNMLINLLNMVLNMHQVRQWARQSWSPEWSISLKRVVTIQNHDQAQVLL